MIHYTCDACQCRIDPDTEVRYVVRIEVYTALDDVAEGVDSDRDHLQEIQDILDGAEEDHEVDHDDDVYRQVRFDLCCDCRKRLLANPLGRAVAPNLGFSTN